MVVLEDQNVAFLDYLLPVMMLKIKIVNNTNSSVTEMIEEPLMIPSQPPILAENLEKKLIMANFEDFAL